jgi:hypothetical protein
MVLTAVKRRSLDAFLLYRDDEMEFNYYVDK